MNDTIETLRDFTRSWARLSGLFVRHPYGAGLGLAEARLLYDIGHPDAGQPPPSAAELARMLAMDTGQVSRLLRGLEQRGLVERGPAAGRRTPLRVTAGGQAALAALEAASRQGAAALLAGLPPAAQEDLAAALGRARALLAPDPAATVLRPPRAGEYGWIIGRHGALYGREQGWDALAFEAHVAQILADFGAAPDQRRQALWIAALGGAPAGSVAVVDAGGGTARLRLLILDPVARGRGLGRALLAEAMGFARAQGYARMTLSTYASLLAARRLYAAEGFGLSQSTPVRHWGQALVAEDWDRAL
ncbi:MarR family transcriptional regulator with acetyltransferase activity [Humitalea rosea]|uniref:MarR family transcriptional regulator with acetyltransferase activity n=1 Tax=Humitalea rosea TaxID=990373 RepID=A0A2W7IFE5_9PROT|nr:bifunctional helix-turn-helix transcriptional regulator/GNAT family N-acetyltransferase [Humitalea rosea]PZW45628.1 MarR family transcriptional regulator with acetyltransferase activity [Humitalea rosea]